MTSAARPSSAGVSLATRARFHCNRADNKALRARWGRSASRCSIKQGLDRIASLQRVFEKTGTARQADRVRIVERLGAVVGDDPSGAQS